MIRNYSKISLKIILLLLTQVIIVNTFAQQNNSTVINDGSVKYFYDSKLQVLNNIDSMNAAYYRVINYRDGKIDGAVTDYYKNGSTMATGYYAGDKAIKGNENGNFTWYYENGKIFQSCNYINGLLNGAYFEFYPSGLKKTMISYVNGKRYGCEYAWDEEGAISHRAFMGEDGVLNNREECDTTYIDGASQISKQSTALKEVFLKEYKDGEYKEIDNSLYYKSKGIKILSVTVLNTKMDTISASDIKAGEFFRVHINVVGLTINENDRCDCVVQQEKLNPDGMGGGSLGALYSKAQNGALEIRIGATPSIYADKIISKYYYLFFYVRDQKSNASIHGFYRYKIRL